mmetsp:Transcript_38969/g.97128  ORF Transcript_38969/g.97128 Transcript_38969/m.97128 type:complete len:225 (+) Transcript_38969:19-693(+)
MYCHHTHSRAATPSRRAHPHSPKKSTYGREGTVTPSLLCSSPHAPSPVATRAHSASPTPCGHTHTTQPFSWPVSRLRKHRTRGHLALAARLCTASSQREKSAAPPAAGSSVCQSSVPGRKHADSDSLRVCRHGHGLCNKRPIDRSRPARAFEPQSSESVVISSEYASSSLSLSTILSKHRSVSDSSISSRARRILSLISSGSSVARLSSRSRSASSEGGAIHMQ